MPMNAAPKLKPPNSSRWRSRASRSTNDCVAVAWALVARALLVQDGGALVAPRRRRWRHDAALAAARYGTATGAAVDRRGALNSLLPIEHILLLRL
jgi:hypothetical protein